MHLWNDYEGTTLAGQWLLGRLLRTEGRSALFRTTGRDGKLAILRLTEALNDQAVLQARFRAIQQAGDTYLVGIEGFGDAVLDGTPLSYAVLEPTQESLADILAQRRLAPEETMEVATSVAGGLQGLHAQGLVHGMVEPESVLAAGDHIKLRSDCARPAPSAEDAALEGAVTPQTDAFGLADVIHRSLTGTRLHDASDALALPEPFATVVRHTARGSWGVPQIQAELQRFQRAHAPVVPVSAPPAPAQTIPAAPAPSVPAASVSAAAVPAVPAPAVKHVPVAPLAAALPEASAGRPAPQPLGRTVPLAAPAGEPTAKPAWEQPEAYSEKSRRGLFLGLAGVVAALLLFLLFHHSPKPSARPATTAATSSLPSSVSAMSPSATVPVARPVAPVPAPHTPVKTAPTTAVETAQPRSPLAGEKVWRVIVYTYNKRGEAASKAASVNQHYPGFDAQVWSRTGERPFLVTLGSGMTEQQAFALRSKARAAGLARDLYAQNYSR